MTKIAYFHLNSISDTNMANDSITTPQPSPHDLEAAPIGHTTDKKDDSIASDSSSSLTNYRLGIAKKLCTSYVLYPAIIVFAVIGMVSVTEDINNISAGDSQTGTYSVVAGASSPLETTDPNNVNFDGHISSQQTKSLSKISKLMGVERFGGEKTIHHLLENVADAASPYSKETDVPFYWEVGQTGSIANNLCKCFQIRMASSSGFDELGHHGMLQPIAKKESLCSVYNVNLGTHAGTQRAKDLGLVDTIVPDFLSSPFLPEIASLFTKNTKARILVQLPNTNARINMSYNYLKSKGLFDGPYLEFVTSNHILANNYLVHVLSGKWGSVQELTEDDLQTAIRVLKEKFEVFRWSDTKKVIEYLIQNEKWDERGYECMYPPKDPVAEAARHAKKEEKKKEVKASVSTEKDSVHVLTVEALARHNYWDNKLYNSLGI